MTKARELSELAHLTSVSGTTATVDGTIVATTFTGDGSSLTGVGTFKPTSVTGATPSLNVGTFNFFDSGTLTANTTVSFASVPTTANWKYSCVVVNAGAFDVTEAVYLQSKGVSSQPHGIFFKPDGNKYYTLDFTGYIYAYDMTTPWDISTHGGGNVQTLVLTTNSVQATGMFFKPDGYKLWFVGVDSDYIFEYVMSSAWDISTAVNTAGQQFLVGSQDTAPTGIFFKPDGTKMYMVGESSDYVNEYDLGTAWLITSAVYLQRFYIGTQDIGPTGLFFNPTGTKMFMSGYANSSFYEYNLSTAYDVTSAVYSQLFSVSAQDTVMTDLFFKPDGTKMYGIGTVNQLLFEYDLGANTTLTLPSAVVGTPSVALTGERVTYEFFTLDGGTTVNLIGEEII